jgi:hypothetical protein
MHKNRMKYDLVIVKKMFYVNLFQR